MVVAFLFLTSLSMKVSSYIYTAANGLILFFFMAEEYSIVYMYHIFLTHSSINGHLGCFYASAIMNSTVVSIWVHVSF